jgi:hypothetical protein
MLSAIHGFFDDQFRWFLRALLVAYIVQCPWFPRWLDAVACVQLALVCGALRFLVLVTLRRHSREAAGA